MNNCPANRIGDVILVAGATVSSAGESYYRGDALRIVRGPRALRRSPAERLVCVFQCYLDDSGTSGLPIVTLGGFVGTSGAPG